MPTEKVYEKQSYCREIQTVVTDCTVENESVYIKLGKSIFFPEEGGQYADTGTLTYEDKTVQLLDGELLGAAREGDTDIRYRVSEAIPTGTSVLCKLDWEKRFDRMQNHSGEHIISGLLHSHFGYNNIGFHLSDDEPVTLLVDGALTPEQAAAIEEESNRIIYENLPIRDSYPKQEDLAGIDYRSKIEIGGQVRLITIGQEDKIVDICACCAPHVSHTGAIGLIRILSVTRAKGGTQLGILCGRRAWAYVDHNLRILQEVARDFSTHTDNVSARIGDLKAENAALRIRVDEMVEEGIIRDIRDGRYDRCVFANAELSPVNMKRIYNALTTLREGYVGLFAGSDEKGYRFYAGGAGLDARSLATAMREGLGAKGGGSREMIQGALFCGREQIEAFWNSVQPEKADFPR